MAWKIEFTPRADRSLEKLDRQIADRIVTYLHDRVANADDPFKLGKALLGPEHANMWRFRIGDYRILTHIERKVVTVFVIEIGHRREVYR